MLILPIDQAKPGMRLAAPVAHPDDPEQDLLKRGYTLEETVLTRLRKLNVAFVYVDYPGLDELDRHLTPYLSPARQKIYTQIKDTIGACQKRSRAGVSYNDYYASMRDMVLTLMSQGQHPIYLDQMSNLGGDAVSHAVSVAHLSLLLGIKLERYLIAERSRLPPQHAREVVNIGVAGMLHDVGKLKLPPAMQKFNSVEAPDEEQRPEWETHSRLSYDMIHDGVEPSAASAVLHHHQHFDGSGFPMLGNKPDDRTTPSGSKIHIFARILFVADLYDRCAEIPNQTQRRSNLEILHMIRTQYAAWCDPRVVAALQAVCPPFPPGMQVELTDGSFAVVTAIDPADLYHPKVRKIVGEEFKLDDEVIDTKLPGAPTIQKVGGCPVDGLIPTETTDLVEA